MLCGLVAICVMFYDYHLFVSLSHTSSLTMCKGMVTLIWLVLVDYILVILLRLISCMTCLLYYCCDDWWGEWSRDSEVFAGDWEWQRDSEVFAGDWEWQRDSEVFAGDWEWLIASEVSAGEHEWYMDFAGPPWVMTMRHCHSMCVREWSVRGDHCIALHSSTHIFDWSFGELYLSWLISWFLYTLLVYDTWPYLFALCATCWFWLLHALSNHCRPMMLTGTSVVLILLLLHFCWVQSTIQAPVLRPVADTWGWHLLVIQGELPVIRGPWRTSSIYFCFFLYSTDNM